MGDILLVVLNTDSSIRKYKSEKRPYISLKYRLQMIAALEFVDFVTYFDETTPLKILDIIKPNVHVNGKEYGKNCIEADIVKKNGGKIHLVNLYGSLSTTKIIKKIKLCE
ncbi:MAG: Bifunctional protein HldE [Candidatus Anoxychlamydiales bacterium]|nr:Bifunctional protein HldE [Candidatus Anoxychlamydiales bacterium]NGX36622.1 Bifunctional protein HldE [Candidatus Anoxychlamydiales bacterium]